MNGAKLFTECLVQQGVEYIFAIPGAKIDALFDALIDTPIKMILCHHEQNAAFMAASYGRLTGKPGVVLVTSGPGVSNLITGLLTANTEGDPIVAIGGSVPRSMKLKESHQSVNNVQLTEVATKKSFEITMVENIPEVVENAFRIATSPRSGATFISIPQDVLIEKTQQTLLNKVPCIEIGAAPNHLIEQASKWLQDAKNPVFLFGLEASRPQNTKAINSFLSKTRFAAVNTFQGAGVISKELLDCFVGRVGLFENQPGDQLLETADLIVAVGFDPVEYDPEIWSTKNVSKKLIHIDYHSANVRMGYVPSLELLGDIAENLYRISSNLTERSALINQKEVKPLQEKLIEVQNMEAEISGVKVHPLRFISDLHKAIDEETIVIGDVGTHYMWLARYFYTYRPHHLLFSNGQQTLGVSLPWAIAAKLAKPKQKVISISGDGGFCFSAMELETAVREKIHFVHCIWVDHAYDMVKQQQLMKYNRETVVEFGKIDFVKFAESFGAYGFRVNDSEELLPILQKAIHLDGPVIIEVPINYSENAELFKKMGSNFLH
ncbi:MAG: acetolactate synthase AlsS [Simkaniaceae bacterium]|nr:acetolactate synthase AlsS [Simkaniaceae bacterium]